MADFNGVSRTSYFRVKDLEAFKKDLENYEFEEMQIFEEDGQVALGGYSDIWIAYDKNEDPRTRDVVELDTIIKRHIAEDDACIFTLSGHEKLRYVTALSIVITTVDTVVINSEVVAVQTAQRLLGRGDWNPKLHY